MNRKWKGVDREDVKQARVFSGVAKWPFVEVKWSKAFNKLLINVVNQLFPNHVLYIFEVG